MFELFLLSLVVITGWMTAVEAYHDRAIPVHCGKFFLAAVAILVFTVATS
jgi:hypothetical protein